MAKRAARKWVSEQDEKAMRNERVAEPFRSILNQFSGGVVTPSNPLLNVPEQYKQRASYDFIDGNFKVCAGGYGLAECEDSEVAHAICMMWNAALTTIADGDSKSVIV